jgi:hypothetical protein
MINERLSRRHSRILAAIEKAAGRSRRLGRRCNSAADGEGIWRRVGPDGVKRQRLGSELDLIAVRTVAATVLGLEHHAARMIDVAIAAGDVTT